MKIFALIFLVFILYVALLFSPNHETTSAQVDYSQLENDTNSSVLDMNTIQIGDNLSQSFTSE